MNQKNHDLPFRLGNVVLMHDSIHIGNKMYPLNAFLSVQGPETFVEKPKIISKIAIFIAFTFFVSKVFSLLFDYLERINLDALFELPMTILYLVILAVFFNFLRKKQTSERKLLYSVSAETLNGETIFIAKTEDFENINTLSVLLKELIKSQKN